MSVSDGTPGLPGFGVRIAVIDSGAHAGHPHVRGVSGGIAFDRDGREHDDWVDRLGHGTAVMAVIREKAPGAAVFALKVFDRELATSAAILVQALDWASQHGMHVANLSLGTANPASEPLMREAVDRAVVAGMRIVSARPPGLARWLPGAFDEVVGVDVDWDCPRDRYRVREADARTTYLASGYPRPIPGVSPEQNLKGVSFAVANVTGLLAVRLSKGEGL